MTQIVSYDTLVQAIQEVIEDDGSEFLAFIPKAIDLAEERLVRELELPDLELNLSGATTAGVPTITKPTGYKFPIHLFITVGSSRKFLKKRSEDYLIDYWPNFTTLDVPKYYADTSATQLTVAPTPNNNYAFTLKYFKAPDKLSSTNQTNYFILNTKDCLYFATLNEMAKFMKAWTQVEFWEKEFVNARDTWNIEASRKRRDGLEVPNNPEGGGNSLKHTVRSNA